MYCTQKHSLLFSVHIVARGEKEKKVICLSKASQGRETGSAGSGGARRAAPDPALPV